MLLDCGMGGGGMGCGIDHSTIALLLIALGVGAIVKYKAIKATSCQTFGKVLGYFIMIVAAVGLVCSVHCAYKSRNCHDGKKGGHDMDEMKMPQGMQLPAGHPDISTMKVPAPTPAPDNK